MFLNLELTGKNNLLQFRERYIGLANINLEMDFLEQASFYGFFNKKPTCRATLLMPKEEIFSVELQARKHSRYIRQLFRASYAMVNLEIWLRMLKYGFSMGAFIIFLGWSSEILGLFHYPSF